MGETSVDDGSDDDIGHLEHAWEMLEMARMIWSKAGKVDLACEALHLLGEVSMEGHNFVQAVADFEDCLSKRIAALPSGSRSIAETHYWHGVALAHIDKWSEEVREVGVTLVVRRLGELKQALVHHLLQ